MVSYHAGSIILNRSQLVLYNLSLIYVRRRIDGKSMSTPNFKHSKSDQYEINDYARGHGAVLLGSNRVLLQDISIVIEKHVECLDDLLCILKIEAVVLDKEFATEGIISILFLCFKANNFYLNYMLKVYW